MKSIHHESTQSGSREKKCTASKEEIESVPERHQCAQYDLANQIHMFTFLCVIGECFSLCLLQPIEIFPTIAWLRSSGWKQVSICLSFALSSTAQYTAGLFYVSSLYNTVSAAAFIRESESLARSRVFDCFLLG